jgi:hypothetical protein
MPDLVRHPLIDEILDARRECARGRNAAFEGYRNHAHRILNFVRAIATLSTTEEEKIAIAPYRGDAMTLVEPFRRADWNDFTMGLVAGGIPRAVRKAADREFPVTAFVPKAVLKVALSWTPRHPLRSAPPFRGGAALRRTGRSWPQRVETPRQASAIRRRSPSPPCSSSRLRGCERAHRWG